MRTYDDSFSGQKIYPGKVRSARSSCVPPARVETRQHARKHRANTQDTGEEGTVGQCTVGSAALTVYTGQALHPW